jgi:uncharacterized membrane protein/nitrite reductase/ring-hydroxylating ferredoxin subunit
MNMFKAFLQGKPFRHPLHPALVHFPIALFLLSLILDILSYFVADSNAIFRAAFYSLAFGIAMALLVAVTGFVDRSDIRLDHPARKTANTHMTLNLSAVALAALNFFLRLGELDLTRTPLLNLLLSIAGVGIIMFSGYLGGTMVYDNGIGVGRHRRDTRTPRETIKVSGKAEQGGWMPVCDAAELKDGETLRVNHEGNIVAIAKRGDEVYAFQEFCTHRFGPLSEGKLEGYQVECPWHRSCFDIRTGKVKKGPAKVDLKTYSAVNRKGKIFIK